jgi:hypothetical protein
MADNTDEDLEHLIEALTEALNTCTDDGAIEAPYTLCGVDRYGSVVALRSNSEGEPIPLVVHIVDDQDGPVLPLHVMVVDHRGKAAKIALGSHGDISQIVREIKHNLGH